MLIPVEIEINDEMTWTFLELQGDLQFDTKEMQNQKMGDLRFEDKIPYFQIANHLLEGKHVPLKIPLAVLQRTTSETSTTTYSIIGIARSKIVFNTRPKTILNTAK